MKTRLTLFILVVFSAMISHSQSVDTIDYSFLSYTELDSFYKAKNINVVAADNPDLYFEIYDWIGTTYRWGGKTKTGIDCSGFASMLYFKLYHRALGGAAGDIYKKCTEVMPSDLKEGDFVFFNINGRYMAHVGVYLQNGTFAHAAVHGGVIVSRLDEAYYKRWFYKAGRLKDPTE